MSQSNYTHTYTHKYVCIYMCVFIYVFFFEERTVRGDYIHKELLCILKSLIMAHGGMPCSGLDKRGFNQNKQGAHPGVLWEVT